MTPSCFLSCCSIFPSLSAYSVLWQKIRNSQKSSLKKKPNWHRENDSRYGSSFVTVLQSLIRELKAKFRRHSSHEPNRMQMRKTLLFYLISIRFGSCEVRRLNTEKRGKSALLLKHNIPSLLIKLNLTVPITGNISHLELFIWVLCSWLAPSKPPYGCPSRCSLFTTRPELVVFECSDTAIG